MIVNLHIIIVLIAAVNTTGKEKVGMKDGERERERRKEEGGDDQVHGKVKKEHVESGT